MSFVITLVQIFWSFLPAMALCAVVLMAALSAPVSRFRLSFPNRASLHSFAITVTLLASQLGVAALERRQSGQSPLLGLPVFGPLFAPIYGERLMVLSLVISVTALLFALTVPSPMNPPTRILASWVVLAVLITLLQGANISTIDRIAFLSAGTSLLAISMLARELTTQQAETAIVTVGLFAIFANFFVYLADPGWSFTELWSGGFIDGARFQGTFPQPNVTGQFFAVMAIIGVVRFKSKPKTYLFLIPFSGFFVYLSGSRGALILIVAAILFAVISRRWHPFSQGATLMLLLLAAVVPATRLTASVEVNGRGATWAQALDLIAQSPILGLGAFPTVGVDGGRSGFYAHNQILQAATETGLLGSLLLAAGFLAFFRYHHPASSYTLWGALVFGVLATFSFENPVRIFTPEFGLIPAIVAIAFGVSRSESHSASESQRGDLRYRKGTRAKV